MSISDGGYIIAEFRILSVSGSRGIGFQRLQFATEIDIQATAGKRVLVSNPTCFAHAGPSTDLMKPLGRAHVETSWFTQTTDYAHKDGLSVFVDLTSEQLEALERVRNGRSIIFRLDFHVIVQGQERGVQRGFQQVTHETNLSAWSKVLKELGYMDVLLLVVELPLKEIPQNLKASVDELRKACEDLIAGRYDTVVGRVRVVMDAIDAVTGAEQTRSAVIQAFASGGTRKAMSKHQRADLVRMAVRHYTHLAHHADAEGSANVFSREDALFVLTAGAAALWDVVGKRIKDRS